MGWHKSSAVGSPESGLDLNLDLWNRITQKLSWGIVSGEEILSGGQ